MALIKGLSQQLFRSSFLNSVSSVEQRVSRKVCGQLTRFLSTSPTIQQEFSGVPKRPYDDLSIEKMVNEQSATTINCLKVIDAGAMSFGSISGPAHESIAEAMNRIYMAIYGADNLDSVLNKRGPRSNSGEGGEKKLRLGTDRKSNIKQVSTGRFGVNGYYLADPAEIEIKVAQGVKPGDGGHLPGEKVTVEIADARGTVPGVPLVSPPPHHDIYSIEDLKQLIKDLKTANPKAAIPVKIASGYGVGIVALGIAKAGADSINIAGPGGTGATSISSKYEVVHPWELGLAEVHQTLQMNGLRPSVGLKVSGGIQTGLDGFQAFLLGANRIEIGSGLLVSLGCIMAEVCHKGTCPVGIATTNQVLIDEKFKGEPIHVARYVIQYAQSVARYLERYGFTDPNQVVGQTDLLGVKDGAPLTHLDRALVKMADPYRMFAKLKRVEGSSYSEREVISRLGHGEERIHIELNNTETSFGARIGYRSIRDSQLKKQLSTPKVVDISGVPGQSFGLLAPKNLVLVADLANDGTAKMLDGGSVYLRGNAGNQTCMSGNSGYFGARFVGDRAFVLNKGTHGVIEQCGQMLAEYMTGGSVVVLGSPDYYEGLTVSGYEDPVLFRDEVVGPNIGASFTGGSLFLPVLLHDELSSKQYYSDGGRLFNVQKLTNEDINHIADLLTRQQGYIDSLLGDSLLENVDCFKEWFVKVTPK
ncbi:hypothetical protein DID75_04680 [Candidatus Marinamargulisbacteria bacterium SCGC AG-410-N11]|nr:hypothetical protein DID75_04680 [Candidatus Marinamargulisbacteria bacterium SCGC AG-410-N11]